MVLSPLPTARADVRRSLVSTDSALPRERVDAAPGRGLSLSPPSGGVFQPYERLAGGLDLGPALTRQLAQLAPSVDVVLGLTERVLADLADVHDAGGAHGAIEVEGFGFDADGVFVVRPSVLRAAPIGAPRESDVQAIGAVVAALAGSAPRLKFWLRGTGATESRVAFRDARAARQALLAVIGRVGVDTALKQWLSAVGARLPGRANAGVGATRVSAAPVAQREAPVLELPQASGDNARRWVETELNRLRGEESARVSQQVREHRGMTDRLKMRVRQSVDPAQLRVAPASLAIDAPRAVAQVLAGPVVTPSAPASAPPESVRLSIPGIRVARVETASVAEIVEVVPARAVEPWSERGGHPVVLPTDPGAPADEGTEETALPAVAPAAVEEPMAEPEPVDVPRPPSAVLVDPVSVEPTGAEAPEAEPVDVPEPPSAVLGDPAPVEAPAVFAAPEPTVFATPEPAVFATPEPPPTAPPTPAQVVDEPADAQVGAAPADSVPADPAPADVPKLPSAVLVDPALDRGPVAPPEPWASLVGLPPAVPLAGSAASLPPLRPTPDAPVAVPDAPARAAVVQRWTPAPAAASAASDTPLREPFPAAAPVAPATAFVAPATAFVAPAAAFVAPAAAPAASAPDVSGPVATEPTPRDTRWLLPEEGTEVRLLRPEDDFGDGVLEASSVFPALPGGAPVAGLVDRVDRDALLAARVPPPSRAVEPERGPVLTPRPDGIEEPGDVFVRPAGVDSGPAWGGAVGVTQNSDRAHEKGPGKWTESGRDAEELASHLPAGPSRPLRLDDPAPAAGMGWVVVAIVGLLVIVAAVAFWPS